MGYVPSVQIAFVMVIISMICWGSWANVMKKCGNLRFEGFYWDYAWSIILWSFLLLVTLGGGISSFKDLAFSGIGWAIFSGFVWGIGNILLVAAIALTGFSVAFPIGAGLALVLGSSLAFVTNPSATHNPSFLFLGLMLAALGVMSNALAYRIKEKQKKTSKYFIKGVVIAVLCGIFISLFPFPFNFAFKAGMSGYMAGFFMTIGAFFSTVILLPILMRKPLIPGQNAIGFQEYKRAKFSWRLWALLGGLVWSIGTTFNLVAASQPAFSVATAYTLGQCAPMVAALWGIFVWKEFKKAPLKSYVFLGLMFIFFLSGIIFLGKSI